MSQPCRNGHVAERNHRGACVMCVRAQKARWRSKYAEREAERKRTAYQANRDDRNAQTREWRANNPEKVAANWAKYYARKGEKLRAYSRAYYADNKDYVNKRQAAYNRTKRETDGAAIRERDRAWCFANRESRQASVRRYAEKHPHKIAEKARRRDALKRQQTPTDADRTKILAVYEMAALVTRVVGASYHVDHAKALANGGLHHEDNLVVMRADLNVSKGASDWPWLKWFNEPFDPAKPHPFAGSDQ